MDKVTRRLGVTIRLDIQDIEKLEVLAAKDRVRVSRKAENIVLEYINKSHESEQQEGKND